MLAVLYSHSCSVPSLSCSLPSHSCSLPSLACSLSITSCSFSASSARYSCSNDICTAFSNLVQPLLLVVIAIFPDPLPSLSCWLSVFSCSFTASVLLDFSLNCSLYSLSCSQSVSYYSFPASAAHCTLYSLSRGRTLLILMPLGVLVMS